MRSKDRQTSHDRPNDVVRLSLPAPHGDSRYSILPFMVSKNTVPYKMGVLLCGKRVSLVVWKAVKSQERAFDRVKNGRMVM